MLPLPDDHAARERQRAEDFPVDVVGLHVDGTSLIMLATEPATTATTMRLLIQVMIDELDDLESDDGRE